MDAIFLKKERNLWNSKRTLLGGEFSFFLGGMHKSLESHHKC